MPPELVRLAKEAHLLACQLRALHEEMKAAGRNWGGYRAFATTYSTHLVRAQEILSNDPTIAQTVSHLRPHDPGARQFGRDFEEIKADLPVLCAALESFFMFHFPPEERKKIGF